MNLDINTISIIINSVLSILSFIITVISIVTVIITVKQNKRLLEANERQISEMREEHCLSVQPIIILDNAKFSIERPRFYYIPPEDSYKFLSRYSYQTLLRNASAVTAICVDVSARLVLQRGDKELSLYAVTERENILPCNYEESKKISVLFAGDNLSYLYEALREPEGKKLPRIKVELVYKNTYGGYFRSRQTFILAPNKSDSEIIRTWHSAIVGAPVEAKETIDTMRYIPRNEKWQEAFNKINTIFDSQLGPTEKSEIALRLIEIPEQYDFCSLSQGEYKSITEKYSYPHFVHNTPDCKK